MRRITETIIEDKTTQSESGSSVFVRRTEVTVEREQLSIEVTGRIDVDGISACPVCGQRPVSCGKPSENIAKNGPSQKCSPGVSA